MILSGNAMTSKTIFSFLYAGALVYFSYLMVLITLQYIPIHLDVAFLRIKQEQIKHLYYQITFFTHVYTCIFVLIAGGFQFSTYLRTNHSLVHRSLGKFYILLILLLAGPSGLVMAYHANGGSVAQCAFALLAILWIVFTYKAYSAARQQQWSAHKYFMYRSYALTLSAISLRLFKWVIVTLFELPPMDTYVIVSWLGWVINLGIAELIIYFNTGISSETNPLIHEA
jgi:uncharacterized membrane protein